MKSFKNNIIFLSFFVKIFIYKSYKGKWEKVIYNPLHLLVKWCVLILLCSIRKLYVSNLYARMSPSVCPPVCRFSKNSTCFANRLETAKNDAIQNSSLPKLVIVYILNFLAFLGVSFFWRCFFSSCVFAIDLENIEKFIWWGYFKGCVQTIREQCMRLGFPSP